MVIVADPPKDVEKRCDPHTAMLLLVGTCVEFWPTQHPVNYVRP